MAEEGRKEKAHSTPKPSQTSSLATRVRARAHSYVSFSLLRAAKAQSLPVAKDAGSDVGTPEAVAQDKKVRGDIPFRDTFVL